jgi:Lon-like protease
MQQGSRSVTAAFVLLAAMLAVAGFVPVPYLTYAPGPVYDTLGSVGGTPLVTISGRATYDSDGRLDMTTVREFGGPDRGVFVADAVRAWFDPAIRIVPQETVYPDDSLSGEQVSQRNAELFRISQAGAVGAALTYLGIPVESRVLVTAVVEGSPSQGRIRAGSEVLTVDEEPITSPGQLVGIVRGAPIGTTFDFVVRRDGDIERHSVTSVPLPSDRQVPFVGLSLGVDYDAPFDIRFALDNVGGPSAGMMFALSIIERLTPGDMTGGKHIAGTGSIEIDGRIGAIGGIQQKMAAAQRAGATLFLAPEGNCSEVRGSVPDGLIVAKVATLSEAVEFVTAHGQGEREFPRC